MQGNKEVLWLPAYHFDIRLKGQPQKIGDIDLRIGYTNAVVRYGGHIGYGIKEAQGHHYAAKACLVVKQVATRHGLDLLWITCNPDNWASRKTCERVGCELVEIVDVPEDSDMYRQGERKKCRYRWILY